MDDAEITPVIMLLLQARRMARGKCAALDRRIIKSVRGDATCRMLMTMPGIGPITAVAYVAALEKPDIFKRSRAVGTWLGLTPRRFQSGEVDYDGHISRRGDRQLRALLYEAAAVLLTRVGKRASPLGPHAVETTGLQTGCYRAGSQDCGGPSRHVEIRHSIQFNTRRRNGITQS
jgi:transposase